MIRVFLICLACCCSSLMPLKQSDSIVSEDHTQVIERKTKNNMFGAYGNCYTASDFLSYDFGQYFYDYISDFDSPRTNNLTYTHGGAKSIDYEFRSEDGPIGQLTIGGFSENLIDINSFTNGYGNTISVSGNNVSVTGAWYYFTPSYTLAQNTTYTISVGGMSGNGVLNIVAYDNTSQNHYFGELNSNEGFVLTFNSGNYESLVLKLYSSGSGSTATSTYSNLMLNVGQYNGYQPYFSGAVQYGGVTATIMKISVRSVFNSQFNTYGYQYFLGFYARVPNEDRLVLGVHSMIIPNLKWLDSQDNLYNAGLFVYSSIELNPSLSQYNLNNFVWREQSEYTRKPITTYYFNKRALALSNDESNALYNEGYDTGYNNGNTAGYQRGYSEGVSYAQEQSSTALTIFTGIIEVGLLPVNVFLKMFEYEVFGINIAGLVSGLITIAMIMILLRFIFGGKQNGK